MSLQSDRYLDQRLQQLNPLMQEILPHRPDLSLLEVVGHNATRRKSQSKADVEVLVHGKAPEQDLEGQTEITDQIQTEDGNKENGVMGDALDTIPDVVDLPMMGEIHSPIRISLAAVVTARSGVEDRFVRLPADAQCERERRAGFHLRNPCSIRKRNQRERHPHGRHQERWLDRVLLRVATEAVHETVRHRQLQSATLLLR